MLGFCDYIVDCIYNVSVSRNNYIVLVYISYSDSLVVGGSIFHECM